VSGNYSDISQGIYGMNIEEIGSSPPRWWAVVATGLPLVAMTILVPLTYDKFIRLLLRAINSRVVRFAGFVVGSIIFLGLFMSSYIPYLKSYHLNLIPIVALVLYSLRKLFTTVVIDDFGRFRDLFFYACFSGYVLVVGVLNSFYDTYITLPFFILIFPMLWFWWHEERIEMWWKHRKMR
jgi:uncharacterized membrane protein